MKMNNITKAVLGSAILAGSSIAVNAEESVLEEIIVTAQKRSESLMDVPVAVTAVNREALQAAGIADTGDIKFVTPGLVFDELNGFPLYYIRGIGADFTQPGVNGSVAIYMDGVFQPLAQTSTQSLLDVEGIEVLKGPQGTLYGRNSTGGAINVRTRRPSEELTAEISAGVSNYSGWSTSAYVSGPITENLSGSIAASYSTRDPFIKENLGGGQIDETDEEAVRIKLLHTWDNGAEAEILLSKADLEADENSSFQQLQNTALGLNFGIVTAGFFPNGVASDKQGEVGNDFPVFWSRYFEGGHFRLSVPFEGFDFQSLTGVQKFHTPAGVDFDATSAPIAFFFSDSYAETKSQEFQLTSTSDGNFQWVAGLYYVEQYGAFNTLQVPTEGFGPPNTIDGVLTRIYSSSTADAYAGYAQGSYTYGSEDQWRVTVGVRYSREDLELDATSISIDGLGTVATFPQADEEWTDTSGKITLDYTTDNSLTYVTLSNGFKSGAYNLPAPGNLVPVEPEDLTAIEVGHKHTFAGGRARAELAAFHYDYEDLQVQFITEQNSPTTLDNAESATVSGIELSLQALATDALQINAGLAYMFKNEYDEYQGAIFYTDNGFGNSSSPGDASGNELSHSPDLTLNFGATYDIDLHNGRLQLTGNAYWSDEYFLEASNDTRAMQDSYAVVNASVNWISEDEDWTVSLWGKNITDEEYFGQKLINALGNLSQYAPPVTFGLTVSYEVN